MYVTIFEGKINKTSRLRRVRNLCFISLSGSEYVVPMVVALVIKYSFLQILRKHIMIKDSV